MTTVTRSLAYILNNPAFRAGLVSPRHWRKNPPLHDYPPSSLSFARTALRQRIAGIATGNLKTRDRSNSILRVSTLIYIIRDASNSSLLGILNSNTSPTPTPTTFIYGTQTSLISTLSLSQTATRRQYTTVVPFTTTGSIAQVSLLSTISTSITYVRPVKYTLILP